MFDYYRNSINMVRFIALTLAVLLGACSPQSEQSEVSTAPVMMSTAEAAAPEPSLGINPRGKTELEIDMSRIHNPDLVAVFDHIDANIDEHVQNLQRWICLLYTSTSPRD